MMAADTWPIKLSENVYNILMHTYPGEFREDYADETVRVFRDDCRQTYRTGGSAALAALWVRALPDVMSNAIAEHFSEWLADHPGRRHSARHQLLVTIGLVLGIVAIFLADTSTPPEVPMAVMYGCVLFAAGSLLRPALGSLICAATLGVYVIDGWVSPNGWTMYRALGLLALLAAGVWALRTGADHARLRAMSHGVKRPRAPLSS